MNKREKHEAPSKEKKVKRVKTHHSRPNVMNLAPVNVDCFHLEEQEIFDGCHDKFKEACTELKDLFETILRVKQGKITGEDVNLSELRTDVCMLVMRLKKLNRLDKHQWKRSRDAVNDYKQKVDALNLQYQNLLYEVTHLQKEVTKCLEFRSKDEEIELVPIKEFYQEAPESISRPDITKNDPHELTMARLLWELEQRKRYAVKLKEAEVTKEEYIQKIKKLKERLSNILPTLNSIIQAAEPLQSKLGMPFQAMHLKHKIAKFLPKPLYILYVQMHAYIEACDKQLQVTVEGNVDEAKSLQMKTEELSDESGESDEDENARRDLHRHSVSSRKEDTKKDILKKHPMTVRLTIEAKDCSVVLEFMYLFHLNIVTVCVKSIRSPQQLPTDVVGDLLKLNTFLNCLFPGDNGKETPNLSNAHLLRKYGYEESPFSNETTGCPYVWVQQICGLDFLSTSNEILPSSSDDSSSSKRDLKKDSVYTERAVKAIRSRLIARIHLTQQIASLEQKTSIPADFASLYPINILSQLKKWTPIQWKDFINYPNVNELKELNVISEDVIIFNAEVKRGSDGYLNTTGILFALLSVAVVISPDYPSKKPLFLLQLFWKGSHTAVSSAALRELEEEVNIHFVENLPEKFHSNILVCQMYHLTVCFDVFLETEYSGDSFEGPQEFVREKVVARSARGRSHSRPYKCVSSQKIFTFR